MMKTCVGLPGAESPNPAWVPAAFPKRPGPKNPFHLAKGWREGRGGGGSGLGSACPWPGAADSPSAALPPASAPGGRALTPSGAGEWGRPFPAPRRRGARAGTPETRRLGLSGCSAGFWASRGRADLSLWRLRPETWRLREEGPPNRVGAFFPPLAPQPKLPVSGRTDFMPGLSAANLPRNLDPRPGKSSSSLTPPRHLPGGRGWRLRARAWPEARAEAKLC